MSYTGLENYKSSEIANNEPWKPLFDGSDTSEDLATLSVFSLASKHRLTDSCITDLLDLLAILLPLPNVFGTDFRQLQRQLVKFEDLLLFIAVVGLV